MAVVEPGPAGGGYYSPPHPSQAPPSRHVRREKAAWKKYGVEPSGQQKVWERQRAFAMAEMNRYGIKVPPGADPVVFYHEVGSKQIYRLQHPEQYRQKPAAMGPVGPAPAGGNIGVPGPDPNAGVGSMGGPGMAGRKPMPPPAAAAPPAPPKPVPVAGLHNNLAPASPAGLHNNMAGKPVHAPAKTFPKVADAKHKLALSLLISALTAKPPKHSAFHSGL